MSMQTIFDGERILSGSYHGASCCQTLAFSLLCSVLVFSCLLSIDDGFSLITHGSSLLIRIASGTKKYPRILR